MLRAWWPIGRCDLAGPAADIGAPGEGFLTWLRHQLLSGSLTPKDVAVWATSLGAFTLATSHEVSGLGMKGERLSDDRNIPGGHTCHRFAL